MRQYTDSYIKALTTSAPLQAGQGKLKVGLCWYNGPYNFSRHRLVRAGVRVAAVVTHRRHRMVRAAEARDQRTSDAAIRHSRSRPNMRLYRQEELQRWEPVIERIGADLRTSAVRRKARQRIKPYSTAFIMSSTTFLASPKTIIVLFM